MKEEPVDKSSFLKSRGWYQWYNPLYWCHEQFGSEGRDPTKWGMSTDEAYEFETNPDSKQKTLMGMSMIAAGHKILSELKNDRHS